MEIYECALMFRRIDPWGLDVSRDHLKIWAHLESPLITVCRAVESDSESVSESESEGNLG
jgi:hypothetical protein